MEELFDFFRDALNNLPQQIAVMNSESELLWVNKAWFEFSQTNGGQAKTTCEQANYFDVCDRAASAGDEAAAAVSRGLRQVISGEQFEFCFEYPCNSFTDIRWFLMRVRAIGNRLFIVTHENITERKIAEFRLSLEAHTDPLTGLANRRKFESFLSAEIKRAQRADQSISLMMIDVDNFKKFNDLYGHRAGDACLQRIAGCLKSVAKRPSDIAARYGGEEFAVLLVQTTQAHACRLGTKIIELVHDLGIPHRGNPPHDMVTASIGIAVIVPTDRTTNCDVVSPADKALYAAKRAGRDRMVVADHDDTDDRWEGTAIAELFPQSTTPDLLIARL